MNNILLSISVLAFVSLTGYIITRITKRHKIFLVIFSVIFLLPVLCLPSLENLLGLNLSIDAQASIFDYLVFFLIAYFIDVLSLLFGSFLASVMNKRLDK